MEPNMKSRMEISRIIEKKPHFMIRWGLTIFTAFVLLGGLFIYVFFNLNPASNLKNLSRF